MSDAQTATQTQAATTTAAATTTQTQTQSNPPPASNGTDTGKPDGTITTAQTTQAQAPADWPSDWRQKLAAGADGKPDEKLLARLERLQSPAALWKSYTEAETKLNEFRANANKSVPFPEKGTPEEQQAWRKERGIPDKPEGYKLPESLTLSDDDKATVGQFLQLAHAKNKDPGEVNDLVSWYFQSKQEREAQQVTKDATRWQNETEPALRKEWGAEFDLNKQSALNVLDTYFGADMRASIMQARLPNGNKAGGDADFLKGLVALARTVQPTITVVPGSGSNAMQAVDDEIAGYEKRMKEDRAGWFKDEKAQARYRDLLAFKERSKAA